MTKKLTLAALAAGTVLGLSTMAFAQGASTPGPTANGPTATQPDTTGTTGQSRQESAPAPTAQPGTTPVTPPQASSGPPVSSSTSSKTPTGE